MEKTDVIYILTNSSFPEYVKIGYAQGRGKKCSNFIKKEMVLRQKMRLAPILLCMIN